MDRAGKRATYIPKPSVVLTISERRALEGWVHDPATPHRMDLRARVVFACANGQSNKQVAYALGLDADTVARWRARFLGQRLAGLHDGRRTGAPRRMKVEELECLVIMTLLSKPAERDQWSTRLLAESCGLSQSTVSRALRGLGLELSRSGTANARAKNLVRLHLALRPDATVLVHRVRTLIALRHWLTACDAEIGPEGQADLILLDAGRAATSEVRSWRQGRPRFVVHIAPTGRHWLEIIPHWFPARTPSPTPVG